MLGLLVPKRWMLYVGIALALVGAVLYIRWDAYNDGVADTTTKYETAIQEERERLQQANEEALRAAAERIAELNQILRARDASIAELRQKARQDPDADRPAINDSSVLRLNRVR